jgi:hypothetical protein
MSKDEDFIKVMLENYKESVDGWSHIYEAAEKDLSFVYDVGEGQWPSSIRDQRSADGRPVITVNKLQKVLRRIRGDHMMNRPRIKVIPVDDKADVNMAELYNGLIRQIEYLSSAETAYDTAYMHALSASFGFFRLVTQYSDDNSFNQDILIKRIINPLSVHFDPYAQEFTLSDARYCFVEELIDQKVFKKRYPGASVVNFGSSDDAAVFGDWLSGDKIRVAEYFWKEPVKKKIVMLKDGTVIPVDSKMTIEAIKHLGHEIVRDREVESHIVKWCKTSAVETLEESEWPGNDIPIIPVFGDEIVSKGKRYLLSLTRGAMGPQQMYNYWATAATETVALAPKMPFILDHRQIKGFEKEWDEANIKNRMYIRYKAIAGLQKPSRENQAQVPTAIMNMMQSTAYDIEDHLGDYQAAKGEASNERSGKAIIARIGQSDKGTYIFVDNFTRSLVSAGRQIIDLVPKIYDTERALRIRGEDGQENLITVNKPVGMDGNKVMRENDLTVGKYDLVATVGASYSSKRQEMVQTMIEAMQYAPQISSVIAPLIFKYSDSPGSQEIYAEIKQGIEQQQKIEMMKEQQGGGVQ